MIQYTVQELIDRARIELDDTAAQPRWSDEFFLRAFNEAEHEACFRARIITDDVTPDTSRVLLVADQGEYILDQRVFDIKSIRLLTDGGELHHTNLDRLLVRSPLWRTHTALKPREFMVESLPSRQIRITLYPKPIEQDTMDSLVIVAYRYPLEPIQVLSQVPEIDPFYHLKLVEWACYRAYMERDPDRYDPVKAADRLASYEATFGIRETAIVERTRRERPRSTTVARSW